MSFDIKYKEYFCNFNIDKMKSIGEEGVDVESENEEGEKCDVYLVLKV